ncbi:hypothetical protein LAHI110946_10345 [Lactococcus hircilactis]
MQKRYSQEFKDTPLDFYHSGQSVTQLAKVKEERDILKKVLTIFAEKKM